MTWKKNLYFFLSVICIFSRHKLAKIAEYFKLTTPRYRFRWLQESFAADVTIFELLTNLPASREHIHLMILPGIEQGKQMAVTVWAQICRQISDRTLLTLHAGPRKLSGPISWARSVWPEQVHSVHRTPIFHIRMDQSDKAVLTNDKRSLSELVRPDCISSAELSIASDQAASTF